MTFKLITMLEDDFVAATKRMVASASDGGRKGKGS